MRCTSCEVVSVLDRDRDRFCRKTNLKEESLDRQACCVAPHAVGEIRIEVRSEDL